MKIGILSIATKKYNDYIAPLHESVIQKFLPSHNIGLLLFTDMPHSQTYTFKVNSFDELSNRVHINTFNVEHQPWPYMTLFRYHIFNKHRKHLENFDYLYYLDADMRVEDEITEEIFPDNERQIVAVKHPGFYNGGGSWENNIKSVAYVLPEHRKRYWAGGFNGGSSSAYLSMCEKISDMLALDQLLGIVPTWHDESYLNRYLIGKDVKSLDSGYIYPENWKLPFKKRIIALDKDHKKMREE